MNKLIIILLLFTMGLSAQEIVLIEGEDTTFTKYPRQDLKPIVGLSDNIEVYFVYYANKPSYDRNKYYLKSYGYTTNHVEEGYPYPAYLVDWTLTNIDTSIVIESYKNKLTAHLSECYPDELKWQHAGFGSRWTEWLALGVDVSGLQHIRDSIVYMQEWITNERVKHDSILNDYVTNGNFPEFNFNNKP